MGERESLQTHPAVPQRDPLLALTCLIAAVLLTIFVWQIGRIGLDLRDDFWTWWTTSRYGGDASNAMSKAAQVLNQSNQLAQDQAAAAGKPPIDIFAPGNGLLDSPWDPATIYHRFQAEKPALSLILRGWVKNYDTLQENNPGGEYDLDYPPLRLLTMTLWMWRVHSHYPNLNRYPNPPMRQFDIIANRNGWAREDVIAHPVIAFNTLCTAIAAIAMMLLVWLWVHRGRAKSGLGWRNRWGDPMLLAPAALLGILTLLSPYFDWQLDFNNGIRMTFLDRHVLSVAFWIFWILRIVAAVGVARFLPHPFRGPACGAVAGMLLWLNPAILLDSHGWPQWDVWPLPFFLLAALLASLDWWLTAGILVGIGCMFKGQILFAAPVLILCPLLAGWPVRFLRFVVGAALSAGLCVWPWLMADHDAQRYVAAIVCAAVIVAILSLLRRPVWNARLDWKKHRRQTAVLWAGVACVVVGAAILSLSHPRPAGLWAILLALAALAVPWALPRRLLAPWCAFVFTAALWLGAFTMNGQFSWWNIGFAYGTQKHNDMQVGGNHLNNLAALMDNYWHWNVHDPVGQLQLPFLHQPILFDLQMALAAIFAAILLLCSIGAAVHFRRRDERFLIAIMAPWIVFPFLLTQMSARYFCWPAAMGAAMAGVSVRLSLLELFMTLIGCITFADRMWAGPPRLGPVTFDLIRPLHPDLGWAALLAVGIFLFWAVAPGRAKGTRLK